MFSFPFVAFVRKFEMTKGQKLDKGDGSISRPIMPCIICCPTRCGFPIPLVRIVGVGG